MQLKLQRTQRMGGVLGRTVVFCLDARAEYSRPEAESIRKYNLGGEIIYSSHAARKHAERAGAQLDRTQTGGAAEGFAGLARGMCSIAMAKMNLNISIASLGRGQHVECKDLSELMEAEEAVMNACRNLRDYLALAATFNGGIVLVDFTDGEKVDLSDGILQLAGPSEMGVGASSKGQPSAIPLEAEFVSTAQGTPPPCSPPAVSSFEETMRQHGADLRAHYARNPTPFQMAGLIACAVAVFALFGPGILSGLIALGFVGFAVLLGRRRGAL